MKLSIPYSSRLASREQIERLTCLLLLSPTMQGKIALKGATVVASKIDGHKFAFSLQNPVGRQPDLVLEAETEALRKGR